MGFETIDFLGLTVGKGTVTPKLDTLDRIRQRSPPSTKKQLRSFLGVTGWYQKFIPNYSQVTAALTDLLRKGCPSKLRWESEHREAFDYLKKAITSSPVLRTPDFALPFEVQTNATDRAVGAILMQEFRDGLFPVSYAS